MGHEAVGHRAEGSAGRQRDPLRDGVGSRSKRKEREAATPPRNGRSSGSPPSGGRRGSAGATPRRRAHPRLPGARESSLPAPEWPRGRAPWSGVRPRIRAGDRSAARWAAAISRAAAALSPSSPSPVSGSPTRSPTGSVGPTSSRKRGMGNRFPLRRTQGLERGGEDLGFLAQREADPHLTPVDGEQAAERGRTCGSIKREGKA